MIAPYRSTWRVGARVGKRRRVVTQAAKVNQSNRTLAVLPKARGTLRQQVASIRRSLRVLAPERKFIDVDCTASNIASPGTVIHVTKIAQGDTVADRTGNGVKLQLLSLRGRISTPIDTIPGTTPTRNSYYRVALVQDKQQIADTSPGLTDIFNPSNPVTVQLAVTALKRFRVLWMSNVFDPRMLLMATSLENTSACPTQMTTFEYNWTGNQEIRFNGTATSDIEKNGVYLIYFSDDANSTLDIGASVRLGFTDA